MKTILLPLSLLSCFATTAAAWSTVSLSSSSSPSKAIRTNQWRKEQRILKQLWSSSSSSTDNLQEDWDDDVDYNKEFPAEESDASPDPSMNWNVPKIIDENDQIALKKNNKLGIDLRSYMDPLSPKEAAELKAAATEIINDAVAGGLDDIEALRKRMTREVEASRQAMAAASEFQAKQASDQLLNKIDRLTRDFLQDTESTRLSTKLAAQADQSMEGTAQGVEVGVWGTLTGAAVLTDAARQQQQQALLGSVQDAVSRQQKKGQEDFSQQQPKRNRVIIIADTKQDPYAKLIVPELAESLSEMNGAASIDVAVYSPVPTSNLPLGGDNAACAVLFATSLPDMAALKSALERLLRKTIQAGGSASGGGISQPPTQLVLVSTVGVTRTSTMPYSMQNLLSGGKLDKRKQMEESLETAVKDRLTEPALDYTIVRVGEIKSGDNAKQEPFQFTPFDTLDGTTDLQTAVTVLQQAIALQPFARNSTLSCVGTIEGLSSNNSAKHNTPLPAQVQQRLDDAFLQLDGPEVWRMDFGNKAYDADQNYLQLVKYIQQWADLLSTSGKGLTTPIFAQKSWPSTYSQSSPVVQRSDGVQLLFLPTNTGTNYYSKEEERKRESVGKQSSNYPTPPAQRRLAKEGGLDVVVEITKNKTLRIRAKRCNYARDAVVKELSESTIVSRLKDAIKVWKQDHASMSNE